MDDICLKIKDSALENKQETFKIEDFDLDDSDREDFHNNVDILFVLDSTGSMGIYIQQAMIAIKKIVEKFSKMEFNIKFSLCTYRDHPPQETTYVTEFTDLCSAKKLVEVLSQVKAEGGGDIPEAVMDGLREGTTKTSWRLGEDGITISKRFLFHICDAPPHGAEYGGGSSDTEWNLKGCPCGTKKEDINKLLNENKVYYHLIKAVSQVNKMEQLFRETFGEYFSETIVLDSYKNTTIETDEEQEKVILAMDKEKEMEKDSSIIPDKKDQEKKPMWEGILDALDKKLN